MKYILVQTGKLTFLWQEEYFGANGTDKREARTLKNKLYNIFECGVRPRKAGIDAISVRSEGTLYRQKNGEWVNEGGERISEEQAERLREELAEYAKDMQRARPPKYQCD